MGKLSAAPSASSKPPALPVEEKASMWETGLLGSPRFISLLLLIGTVLVFSPVVRNEFVNYDDSDYVTANGIRLPTRRRAYTRGPDRRPILEMLMVSIDLSEVGFE